MDFTGQLSIVPSEPLPILAEKIGMALLIVFSEDKSGRYEEFPAFVADVLGMEIAILGIPCEEYQDSNEPITTYSLLVRTIVDAPDDSVETDISIHLSYILGEVGIACSPETIARRTDDEV